MQDLIIFFRYIYNILSFENILSSDGMKVLDQFTRGGGLLLHPFDFGCILFFRHKKIPVEFWSTGIFPNDYNLLFLLPIRFAFAQGEEGIK